MPAFIVTALVGVVCIVLGISNMKGNISSLIGTGILIAGIIVGLVISFKAMIKYNKGIF